MSRQQEVRAPSFEQYAGNAAENYERYFVPAIGAPLAEQLVELADLDDGERVLDLACGTGVVARLAADRVGPAGSVTGVDLNPGMIGVAREAAGGRAIDWREGRAEELPLADAGHDVVLCQLALQFFVDRSAALAEAARVLVPGGRLLVSVPGPVPTLFAELDEALEQHVGEAAARFVGQVFSLYEPGALEQLLGAAAFEEVSVNRSRTTLPLPPARDFLWQYVSSTPLAASIAELGPDARAELEDDVARRWGDAAELAFEVDLTTASGVRASG